MSADQTPPEDSHRPSPPSDSDELYLWLLGELSPADARRVEELWAPWPEEVARARRFLGVTENAGGELRRQARRMDTRPQALSSPPRTAPPTPAPLIASRNTGTGFGAAPPDAAAPRNVLMALMRSTLGRRVPRHWIPVAILAPVVIATALWLSKSAWLESGPPRGALLEVLSPTAQLFDQGNRIPTGPVRVNAQLRLLTPNAAVRLSWSAGACAVTISGQSTLLVTDEALGLMQQSGEAMYEALAREAPLRLFTAQGVVEAAEARLRLTGGPTFLQYQILEGSVLETATGKRLFAPASGSWGSPRPAPELLMAYDPAPDSPGALASATPPPAKQPGDGIMAAGATAATAATTATLAAAPVPLETPLPAISGRVCRTDNSAVEGARVALLWRAAGETRRSYWEMDRETTVTAANGLFAFRGLDPAGEGFLTVSHDSLITAERSIAARPGGEPLEIVLYETSSISGAVAPETLQEPPGAWRMEIFSVVDSPEDRRAGGRLLPLRGEDSARARIRIEGERFEITGLRPETWRLRVTTEDGQTGESEDISLGLEEDRGGVEIRLAPGGALEGVALDGQSATGVAGAEIALYASGRQRANAPRGARGRGEEPAASQTPAATALTAKDGSFSVVGLKPGRYEIRASAEDYQETRATVEIQPGETARAVLRLFQGRAVVFGRVVDPQGGAVVGAVVRAENLPDRLYERGEAVTDTEGAYEIEVAPARWRLRAEMPEDRNSWAQADLEIQGEERARRDFILYPGARITGTVTRRGEPVRRTGLVFRGVAGSRASVTVARTDDTGAYEAFIRPGRYEAYVLNQSRGQVEARAGETVRFDISIHENMIHGVITDAATQAPIARAQVMLERLDAAGAQTVPLRPGAFSGWRYDRANQNGYYEFTALEPGEYCVRASATSYAEVRSEDIVIPADRETIQDVSLALDLTPTILEAVVSDAETGETLPGVLASRVISMETGENVVVLGQPRVSDERGLYLITNLRPGLYNMTFQRVRGGGDYLPAEFNGVAVTEDGQNHLDVLMRRGGAIEVEALRLPQRPEDLSVPVADARARLIPATAELRNLAGERASLTDLDGRAAFRSLPPGGYTVEVTAEGYRPALQTVHVASGALVTLNILLALESGE